MSSELQQNKLKAHKRHELPPDAKRLKDHIAQYAENRRMLFDRMRKEAVECLDSPDSTDIQREVAQHVLNELRRTNDWIKREDPFQAAVSGAFAGMCYERMRFAPYRDTTKEALAVGTHWRGQYIRASEQQQKMIECLHGRDEVSINDFTQHVWGEGYSEDHRSRIDKALAGLRKAFREADPPIRATLSLSAGRILVTEVVQKQRIIDRRDTAGIDKVLAEAKEKLASDGPPDRIEFLLFDDHIRVIEH